MGSQYWSNDLALAPGIVNPVSIDVGGGALIYTLTRDSGSTPMQGINSYLYSAAGAYMGLYGTTDAAGQVSYDISEGSYKVRSDYLGYQFYSDVVDTTQNLTLAQDIPHMAVNVGVLSSYQGTLSPMAGVKTYLFKSSGAYMGKTLTTDASGMVTYDLPQREYKVRGDYLGYQWFTRRSLLSPIALAKGDGEGGWTDSFVWEDTDIVIPEGEVTVTVTDSGVPVQGSNVYVYSTAGAYMGLYLATGANGQVSFLLPAEGGNSSNYAGYKFRADYSGTQTYSDPVLVTADVNNPVEIPVGGSAALEDIGVIASPERSLGRGNPGPLTAGDVRSQSLALPGLLKSGFAPLCSERLLNFENQKRDRRLSPIARRATGEGQKGRGDPTYAQDTGVQVASLFLFPGLLAQAANAAFSDSNGEFLYYYHSDHLGTPLFLTNTAGDVVWKGEYLPFGDVFSQDTDPDGDGVEVDQPFRFPGQYEDSETGLYYNYFRDYNSWLGRYVEADPIGLAGGVNLWGYGLQRPISITDMFGLDVIYRSIIQNQEVLDVLNWLDLNLPGADIIVTGGDRYYDKDGDICSSTDDSIIPESSRYSTHLSGIGVDFYFSNMSTSKDLLVDYFDWLKDDYKKNPHIHGDIRGEDNNIVCPTGMPRSGYPFGAFGEGCE